MGDLDAGIWRSALRALSGPLELRKRALPRHADRSAIANSQISISRRACSYAHILGARVGSRSSPQWSEAVIAGSCPGGPTADQPHVSPAMPAEQHRELDAAVAVLHVGGCDHLVETDAGYCPGEGAVVAVGGSKPLPCTQAEGRDVLPLLRSEGKPAQRHLESSSRAEGPYNPASSRLAPWPCRPAIDRFGGPACRRRVERWGVDCPVPLCRV